MEKAPAGTVNPKDSQRAACSRTDALRPSRRTTAEARTTNGVLGTGHGPVSGRGSAGEEAAFVGAADSRTEREADPEQRLLLPRGHREMLCLSTAKCTSGPSLSAAFIPRAHPRSTGAPPAAPLRASYPEETGKGPTEVVVASQNSRFWLRLLAWPQPQLVLPTPRRPGLSGRGRWFSPPGPVTRHFSHLVPGLPCFSCRTPVTQHHP